MTWIGTLGRPLIAVRLPRRIGLVLGLLLIASGWAAPAAGANTLCVNQGGTGGCFGTITAAVAAAGNGDTIRIAGGSPYFEHLTLNKSLSLIGVDPATTIIDGSANGQLIRITTPVTVTLSNLTIRNGQAGPGDLFEQSGGGIHNFHGNLTLNHVVVTGNHTGGGNICCGGNGGGIASILGGLTLNNSTVSGNVTGTPNDSNQFGGVGGSGGVGGGIFNQGGPLTLNNSTVSGNATGNGANGGSSLGEGGNGGDGGGLATIDGPLILNHSTVSGNTTGNGGNGGAVEGNGGAGGGIYDGVATLTLNASTVADNLTGTGATLTATSGNGAGLYLEGFSNSPLLVTIATSTFSGNETGLGLFSSAGGDGGAIYTTAGFTVTLTNTTLAYNVVDVGQEGGGIANNGGTVNVKNSLLAHNHTQDGTDFLHDCSGALNSLGYNVMMEPVCTITPNPSGTTGDQFFVAGLIALPLADNGGPTQTNALPLGSPAIDGADNSTCPATDQRGFARPVFGGLHLRCDVGAFELYRFGSSLPLLVR